jgi:Recombination directionality factor-like
MPIRLIDQQRALAVIGAIRMGERKEPNRPGFQRSTFRFTSPNKIALEKLQKVTGGTITPWPEQPGAFELNSNTGVVRVIIDTELSFDQNFQMYDGKTPCRNCDGITCRHIEVKRGDTKDKKKITDCIDHGFVPCVCDPDGLQNELPDKDRLCDRMTELKVMLPDTDDVTLWRFQSKGTIFNKEVQGAIDSFRALGFRRGYCLLSINLLAKHRGNEVSKFGVARLTLDPEPPDFVQRILANTPEAQARVALIAAGRGNELPQTEQAALPPQEVKAIEPKEAEVRNPNPRGAVFALLAEMGLPAHEGEAKDLYYEVFSGVLRFNVTSLSVLRDDHWQALSIWMHRVKDGQAKEPPAFVQWREGKHPLQMFDPLADKPETPKVETNPEEFGRAEATLSGDPTYVDGNGDLRATSTGLLTEAVNA